MKTTRKLLAILMLMVLVFSGTAFATTPEEIAASTGLGMEWLAGEQYPDGSWGDTEKIARTGLALLKFETHALNDPEFDGPFDEDYDYDDEVILGLNYIFENALIIPIDVQINGYARDPDSDADGEGVYFSPGHHAVYNTSVALMAIVANGEPERIVVTTGGSPLDGMTYKEVAQDIVDYLAWAQTDPASSYRGGWNYEAMDDQNGRSDNSISGYATMGLAFAEHPVYNFECDIPDFVRDELELWVNYIQYNVAGPNHGGSGYTSPSNWINLLKTGNLLQQLAFIGAPITDQRVVDAIGYIETHWNDANWDPGWKGSGSGANYQATFTLMKGLHAYDIELIDIGGDFDWFDDIATQLLSEQMGSNAWPQTLWDLEGNYILSTTWALLTLQKVAPPPPVLELEIDIKPGSDPNAINMSSKGVVPVAILGSDEFDVQDVDTSTVMFSGGSGTGPKEQSINFKDVNGDGYEDLVMHFRTQDTGIILGQTEATLICETYGGLSFTGMDYIKVVPK